MADPPDTKLRITGEDKTASTIKSVGDGFRKLSKEVQGYFKEIQGTLISTQQLSKRTFEADKDMGKARIRAAEEVAKALKGIHQENISSTNLYAQALQKQNEEAAKTGKTMMSAEAAKAQAATKAAEVQTKATRNYVASNADLHKMWLANKKAATEAGESGAAAGTKATRATSALNAAVSSGVHELAGMAAGWMSVHKAIDIAKESFMGFAEFDDKMKLMKISAGWTTHQTEEFEEVIKRTARSVGTNTGEMADAFKIMGDTAGLAYDQIKGIYPQVALMAKGANVSVGAMARSVSDTLRNLNIAPEKAGEAMEIMWAGMSKLNVDIAQMGPHLNRLTSEYVELGYSGTDALLEIEAVMGQLNKITGSTSESAQLYQRMISGIATEYQDLGFATQESLMKHLKDSGNPFAALVDLYRQSSYQEELFAKTAPQQRRGLRKLLDADNKGLIAADKKMMEEMAKNRAGQKAALERMDDPLQQINKMVVMLDQLKDAFGGLLNDLGASTWIKSMTTQFDELRRTLETIRGIIKFIRGEGEWSGEGFMKAAPWKPRYSAEELKEMREKPFYETLPPGLKQPFEWVTKGLPGPFGLWGRMWNKDLGNEHGAEPEHRAAGGPVTGGRPYLVGERGPEMFTPHTGGRIVPGAVGSPQYQQQIMYQDLTRVLRLFGEEIEIITDKLKLLSIALPDDQKGVAMKAMLGVPGFGFVNGRPTALAPGATGAGTGTAGTYGTSTDSKFLNANYIPGGIGGYGQGGVGGYGPGGYGPSQGVGSDGTPETAGPPGSHGTGYGGGTRPTGGYQGPGDGQTPAQGTPDEPAPTTTTTGQPIGGGTVGADQGARTPGSERGRIAMAKQAMIDEAIKQGVSPEHAKEAANLMAGQGLSESELNPTLPHDSGTGYGIYGARLGRRDAMFKWLKDKGYSRDSLAGQSRYMMQEALSKDSRGRYKYPKTAAALKSADPRTRAEAVRTLTKEFEAPADQGQGQMDRRLGRTNQAAGVEPGGLPTAAPAAAPADGIPMPGGLPAQPGTSATVLPPELRAPGGTSPEPGAAGAAGGPNAPGVATGDRLLPGKDIRGTDPRIKEIVTAAAEALPPGYKIAPTSGVRTAGQGQHTHGRAVDWQIIGPDNKPIANRGDDKTGLYTRLAQAAYGYQEKYHPQLTGQFQWGGQFGTSSKNPNEPDLMHFDTGGRRGRITRYSRERIGTIMPPRPGDRPATPPPPATASRPSSDAPPVQPTDDVDTRARPAETSDGAVGRAQGRTSAENRDINMNVNVNASQVQFARNTLDRQVYASMDRSRQNSYHDIGTA